ncbi:MAG: PKD domain-containing protein [Saprospiraceae bacterium]
MGRTEAYATSFVEVAEWVAAENTQMANGVGYNDLESSDGEASCLANSCVMPGQYGIQLSLNNFDCSTNTACYDVQLSSTDGTPWGLAGQNYRLYYDANLGSYQSGISLLGNTDYDAFTLVQDLQNQDATGTGNLGFESNLSFLNYTIDLLNTIDGSISLLADGSWVTTSQLCFQLEEEVITDANTCFEAIWARMDTSAAYATSFVEVSQWISSENTQMADGVAYGDLGTPNACFENVSSVYDTVQATICEGDFYFFGNTNLTVAGNYNDTLVGTIVCDSIVTLNLSVIPLPVLTTRDTQVCIDKVINLAGLVNETANGIKFYPTEIDAINETNEVSSNWTSTTTTSFYARQNSQLSTTCFVVVPINITVEACSFDLALEKTIAPNQPLSFKPGDTVHYHITVFNQGELAAYNIAVNDYPQAGLYFDETLNQPNWTIVNGNYRTNIQGPLASGAMTTVDVYLTIDENFQGTKLNNVAEIVFADDDFSGSNPNPKDDDSVFNNGVMEEDDQDEVEVTVSICNSNVTTINKGICQGQSYTFNNQVYTTAGTYKANLLANNGCDSTVVLNLTVNLTIKTNLSESICEGESYTLGTQNLTQSGIYNETFQAVSGCDSIVTLNLKIIPLPTLTLTETNVKLCLAQTLNLSNLISSSTGTITYHNSLADAQNEIPSSNIITGQGAATYYIKATTSDGRCTTIERVNVSDAACTFDLALDKKLANTQLSGVKVGDTIYYTINVHNQGDYDAYDIGVVDYIPSTLSFVNSAGWTAINANRATTTINYLAAGTSTELSISLRINPGAENSQVTNFAEIFIAADEAGGPARNDDDSTLDNIDNNDGTPINNAIDNPNDEDDHDYETIEVGLFDLALTKNLAPNQAQTVGIGDDIDYRICVTNEGNITAYQVLVTDYIPSGLSLSTNNAHNNDWTIVSAREVNQTIQTPIVSNQTVCLDITLVLNSGNAGDDFKNVAEISGQQDEAGNNIKDTDSTPDNEEEEGEEEEEDDEGAAIITLLPCPEIHISPSMADICQGESIQLDADIDNVLATYSWTPTTGLSDPFSANPIANPTVSTTYIVAVDVGLDCLEYDTVRINVFDVPNPAFQATTVCQGTTTNFTDNSVTYTTLTGWVWDFGGGVGVSNQQNPSYTYANAGIYQVTLIVESTNGCRDSITKEVTVNPTAQAFSAAKGDTICIGACVELKAQGGSIFQWSNGATLNHDTCFNPIACPTETTTYVVTVTNDFGCANTDSVTVTVIPGPTVDVAMTNVTECGQFDGTITINATGLTNNYEYSIDGGLTFSRNNTFTNLPASSYLIVVKGTGCEVPYANNPVIIGDGVAPMITSVPLVNPACDADNGSISINANGADLQYSINGGINFSPVNEFTDLAGGTYFIAVSANGGNCVSYYPPVTLVKPIAPTFTDVSLVNPSDCDARDGAITIIAAGAEAVEYGLDNGIMTIWQSSNNFINLPTGQYDVYTRNAGNTCVTSYALNSLVLEGPTAPTLTTVAVNQPTDCGTDNASVNITATAGSTSLEYSIDGGINWNNTGLFDNLQPGVYNVSIRNEGSTCEIASTQNPINIRYPERATIVEVLQINPTDCGLNDGLIEITAEGGAGDLIYSVNAGATWQESSTFANLTGGIYNIRVANSDESCAAIYPTITLVDPIGGTIDNVIVNDNGCENGTGGITIEASSQSALEYSIDGGGTWQSSNNFINLLNGDYNVAIRNINDNCLVTYTGNPITISGTNGTNTFRIDQVVTSDPTSCESADGTISITASGSNLAYSIDGGINFVNHSNFDDLAGGIYNVFIKDNNTGCTAAYAFNPVNLISPTPPSITSVAVSNPSDCKANDAMIAIVADGTEGLQYSLDGVTWSNGNSFINLLPGLYNVWVRNNDESCAIPYNNNPVVVNAPTGPIITDCIGTNPTDCGVEDGRLMVLATGGQGNLQYSIDDGLNWQTSNQFTGLTAGIYQISVANEDGTCIAIHPNCALVAPALPIINEVLAVSPSDCGVDNGSITILADGQGGLEYSINNGLSWSGNSFYDNLPAGDYTILVRNAADNCEAVYGLITLDAPVAPTVIVGMENTSTCTGDFVPASITISENIIHYTILGSGGYLNTNVNGATLTFDAYLNGVVSNFTVTIYDEEGCAVVEEFAIFQAGAPEAEFIVQNPICAESDVTIEFTGTASPGAALFWEIGDAQIISSSLPSLTAPAAASIVVRWDTPGGKTISLDIDDGECTDRSVQNINVNKLPFADAGKDITICDGECVQLEGLGNGSQYQWSPAIGLSATDIPNPLACPPVTTTYQLLVMGAEGCMVMDEITVTVAGTLTADAGIDQSVCDGESIQLQATGGVNYEWTPSTGLSNPNIANPTASPQINTTYTVKVTNAAGCVGYDDIVVTVNPSPIVDAGQAAEICMGENTMLSASGGISYEWSPTIGLSATNVPNPIASPTTTTTYTVVGTDANGCSSSDQVTVIVGANAQANAGADQTICQGGNTILNASGGVAYSWSPSTGLSNPNIANPVANPSTTTTYTVTVTNAAGCTSTDEVTIIVNNFIAANAGADQTICQGSAAFLNATGGITYNWSPSTGLSNPNIANPIANPLVTTTYTVTATTAQGCTATDQVIVSVNNNASINAGADQTICQGSAAFLNATGGITYNWSPNTGLSNPNIANPVANPLVTTTYTVTATTAQGCTATDQVMVFIGNDPTVIGCPDKTICGGGSVRLTVNGGVSWVWSPATGLDNPFSPAPNASPSTTTVYTVTGTDANGCSSSDEVIVFVGGNATANAGPDQTVCSGQSTQMNASGGISYNWSPSFGLSNPNIPNPTLTPIATTTYTVEITNAAGCRGTDEVTVFVNNDNANINAGNDARICAGSATQLNATGGVTYSWSPSTGLSNSNIANPIANPLVTTTYTVTSVGGCGGSDQVTVFVNQPTLVVGCEDKTICLGGSTPLTVTSGVSYLYTPATGLSNPTSPTPIASPTQTTTYTVFVTDANGCTASDQITVFVNNNGSINAGTDQTICQGGSTQLNASGGVTYQWVPITGLSNPNIANPIASPTSSVTYTVYSTNSNGCQNRDDVVVYVTNSNSANAGVDQTICQGSSTQLNASGGITYQWVPTTGLSNPNIANPVVSPTSSLTYSVYVTSAGGCTNRDDVVISVAEDITVIKNITNPGCCNNNGNINLNVAGTGNLSYNWTPNVSTSHFANNLAAGNYKILITDGNGCQVIANINLIQNCETCVPIATENVVCVPENETVGEICLPVNLNEIHNYQISANGQLIAPNHGCDFENLTAYSYALLSGAGNSGPYKIDNWLVNGVNHSGMVNNATELTTWMNSIDPSGNWTQNAPILIVMGGNPINNYGDLKITHQITWVETTLNPNITGVAKSTLVEVPMGNSDNVVVTIRNIQTCCEETVLLKRCVGNKPDCEDFIEPRTASYTIDNCEEKIRFCVPILSADLGHYVIEQNGSIYTDDITKCETDSDKIQLYAGAGKHVFKFINQLTDCADEIILKVNCQNTSGLRASRLDFAAFPKEEEVALQWATNTGYKNDYFLLEKSTDGTSFEAFGRVENEDLGDAATGYTNRDTRPSFGNNYYRIKQVYIDGTYDYTSIKEVVFYLNAKAISIFPNPAIDLLNINLREVIGKAATVQVANNFGQVIKTVKMDQVEKGIIQIPLNEMTNGFYQVIINVEGKRIMNRKLVINRMY